MDVNGVKVREGIRFDVPGVHKRDSEFWDILRPESSIISYWDSSRMSQLSNRLHLVSFKPLMEIGKW